MMIFKTHIDQISRTNNILWIYNVIISSFVEHEATLCPYRLTNQINVLVSHEV